MITWTAPDRVDIRSITNGSIDALEATKYFSLQRQGKVWRVVQDTRVNQEEEAVALCFAKLDEDRAFAEIGRKINRRTPTFYQLNDPTYATKAEATALRLRAVRGRTCTARRNAIVHERLLGLEPSHALLQYQDDQVLKYLTQGLITYGDANRLARDALYAFHAREGAYFYGITDRDKLTQEWRERLQRARPSPPPDGPRMIGCVWVNDNITCD